MEEDLYDEFGNYIGPDLDLDGSDNDQESVRNCKSLILTGKKL